MSALGHKQTYAPQQAMSAFPPIATVKADIRKRSVCFTPKSGHVRCQQECLLWVKSGPFASRWPCLHCCIERCTLGIAVSGGDCLWRLSCDVQVFPSYWSPWLRSRSHLSPARFQSVDIQRMRSNAFARRSAEGFRKMQRGITVGLTVTVVRARTAPLAAKTAKHASPRLLALDGPIRLGMRWRFHRAVAANKRGPRVRASCPRSGRSEIR